MPTELVNLRVDEGTLCPAGANQGANIALFKTAPRTAKTDDEPESFDDIQQRRANQEALSELWSTLDTFDSSVRQIMNSDAPDKEARINESLSEMLTFLNSAVPQWAAGNTVNKGGEMPKTDHIDPSKLDKDALLKLATEATQKVATLTAKDAEREAAIKAKDTEIAALKKAEPSPQPEDVLKSLTPEARALVEKAQADSAAAQKTADEATALAKSEREARVTKEWTDKARVFKALPVKPDTFGPVLMRIAGAVSKEDLAEVERVLAAADAGMATALAAQGSDGAGETGGEAVAEVEKRAAELMKTDRSLTIQKARVTVRRQDPDLAQREKAERAA